MRTAGVICEYNPLHLGHIRHLEQTRAAGAEAVVCVMSGNFVQRGDFAVYEKHARARAAVMCGADLVMELPAPWSLASAERFAFGGVYLLDALGICDMISFGSECGDIGRLARTAELLLSGGADAALREAMSRGISFARAREQAVRSLSPDCADVLARPNDILAVEYIKALRRLGSVMEPQAVRRRGAGHDGTEIDGTVSASFLRGLLERGESLPENRVPVGALRVYGAEDEAGRGPVFAANAETAILSRLRRMSEADFLALPDSNEGLHLRLMRAARSGPTLRSVIESAKTKRYAESRLRRMLMCAYLGITAQSVCVPPQYGLVLAFNARGRELLHLARRRSSVPIITKPSAARRLPGSAGAAFAEGALADDLYALAFPSPGARVGGQGWTAPPAVLTDAGKEKQVRESCQS